VDEDEEIEVAGVTEKAEELFVAVVKNQWQWFLKKLGRMNSLQAQELEQATEECFAQLAKEKRLAQLRVTTQKAQPK